MSKDRIGKCRMIACYQKERKWLEEMAITASGGFPDWEYGFYVLCSGILGGIIGFTAAWLYM